MSLPAPRPLRGISSVRLLVALLTVTALSGCFGAPQEDGFQSLDTASREALRVEPEEAQRTVAAGVHASFRGACTDPAGDLERYAFVVHVPGGIAVDGPNGTVADGTTALLRVGLEAPGDWRVDWTCTYAAHEVSTSWDVTVTESDADAEDDADGADDGSGDGVGDGSGDGSGDGAGDGTSDGDGSDDGTGDGSGDPDDGTGSEDPDDGTGGTQDPEDPEDPDDPPVYTERLTARLDTTEPCIGDEVHVLAHLQDDDGNPIADAFVETRWYYRTVTSGNAGYTDENGDVDIMREALYGAEDGYEVTIEVKTVVGDGELMVELQFTPKAC